MLSLGGDQKLNPSLEAEREIRGQDCNLQEKEGSYAFLLGADIEWPVVSSGQW